MSRLKNVFKTLVAMFALCFALQSMAAQYTYDQLGRLTSVVESDGSSITYTYDANGNMTSISRTGATQPLTLVSFSPAMGTVGTTVVIRGTGFTPVPAQNTVKFNGVTANVTSANASTIVATVPAGATTGPISVTTAAGTVTSSGSFAVVTVQITDFTPTIGAAGTSVTINGLGFDATPANNVVKFNTTTAVVSTASTTQLTVPVPAGASAGHISVTTPAGSAVSAGDFIVPPPGYSAGQFEMAGRLNWPGSGLVFTVNSPSKLGLALFDGAQGQRLSLVLTNLSMNGTFKIFAPDGTVIRSGSLTTGVGVLELGPLSATGTYSFVMIPTSSAGSVTLRLVPELLGTLQTDGTPRPTTLVMSQNARFTFNVIAGESYNFAMTNFVAAPANTNLYAVVYRADGSTVATCPYQVGGASSCHFTATETATYTLFLDAPGQAAATFDGRLNVDFRVTLLHGVPNGISLDKQGRNATLSFSVAAGQDVTLNIAPIVTSPGNGTGMFRVFTASGTQISSNAISGSTFTLNLKGLAAGNYNAVVFINNAATATFTATMAAETPSALTSGTTVTRTAIVPAQSLFYTFSATAGQGVGIGLTNGAFVSGASGSTYLQVMRPDGSFLLSTSCSIPGRCQFSLRNLPSTGTYRLELITSAAEKLGVGVTFSPSITGTLTVDTPLNLNFASPGQNALLTFTTSSVQSLPLVARLMNFNPAGSNLLMRVINAAGSQVATASGTATASMTLTSLPAGTYTVAVESTAAATGSVQILLTSGTPIAIDGTPIAFSAAGGAGENAYYTFAGTAGQSIGIGLTNQTLSPAWPNNIYVAVYKPDGSTLATAACYPSINTGCQVPLRALPATGTYRLEVLPGAANQTMSFTLRLTQALGGAISPSATPLALNFATAGQFANYTFTATAGQVVALRLDPTSITPTNSELVMRVFDPSGSQVGYVAITSTGAVINLPNLVAGTYTVTIVPTYAATGQAQFKLLPGMTGTLTANGISTNYSAGAPGQVGYFYFAGTAGQSLGLGITNVAIAPSSDIYYDVRIYKPDGSQLTSNSCNSANPGCQFALNALPTTGTYRVELDPGAQSSANFTLTLSQSLGGAISPNNTAIPINFNVPGAYARYTLTAATGDRLTVQLTPTSMTPVNSEVSVRVYNPSGTQVQNFAVTYTGATANLVDLVAGTYSIVVAPTYAATGTAALSVATPTNIPLVVNGTSANLTSAVLGQMGYMSFSATAGQNLNLGMTGLALTPHAPSDVLVVRILKPNNTLLTSVNCYTSVTGEAFALLNLPLTGNYRVEAAPGAQQTFTANFQLSSGVTGTLAAGTPLPVTLPTSGSFAWISFTTTATQTVPITISSLAMTPTGSQVLMRVYNSSGAAVGSYTTTTTSPATLTFTSLPAGTYTIFVQPTYAATGSFLLSRP